MITVLYDKFSNLKNNLYNTPKHANVEIGFVFTCRCKSANNTGQVCIRCKSLVMSSICKKLQSTRLATSL